MKQQLTIEITGLSHQGEGIGRLPDGTVVFVPKALVGEKVFVEVVERKKNFARAKLVSILEKSDKRCEPKCKLYDSCGGCLLQHLNYDAQLVYKAEMVRDSLKRLGKLCVDVLPAIGMKRPWHYRNKVHLQFKV